MSWSIIYSAQSRNDLQNIYMYIANELMSQSAAEKQSRRIMQAIRSLNEMPFRHQRCADEPWHQQGLRFVTVDHYLVFYLPDELSHSVKIIRIMYGRRDINRQLQEKEDTV